MREAGPQHHSYTNDNAAGQLLDSIALPAASLNRSIPCSMFLAGDVSFLVVDQTLMALTAAGAKISASITLPRPLPPWRITTGCWVVVVC